MKSGDGCTISDRQAGERAGSACGRAVGARGATPSGLGATLNFGYALPLYNVRCSAWDMAGGSCNCGMARYFICRSIRLFDSNETDNERWSRKVASENCRKRHCHFASSWRTLNSTIS